MPARKIQFIILFCLFLGVVLVFQAIFAFSQAPFLEINFFDVGEGDAAMIEPSKNTQILIDGGPSGEIVEKIAKEMPFFDREIELMILTHPDKDHITGLFDVFKNFKVDKVLMPQMEGDLEEKDLYLNFQKAVEEEGSEMVFAKEGQKISFGNNAKMFILWPPQNFQSGETNDYSVVAKLSFGDVDFLFTGDAPKKVEYQLLANNYSLSEKEFSLDSEILKVAHHGSKYSSDENFLKAVSPDIAVISVGKNSYGHPTKEVLDNLQKYGIVIYRTDKNGNIKVISNGQDYQVLTQK
ncbi:MAG TPA: MBL fold metallo-hydrolase [Candidatus Pacearchaeota archaeon]|nr:MBL fold metallo-hydrolase [Candidatus Pacearchaeota archaeon]HOK94388.1 MBL fold metallo-hydrolase [Candidatus Pacearchaeota archaeon]HPO75273.1 MBL fold metallo-hydrolase [Candidatus Pacearchaeota archaeon]